MRFIFKETAARELRKLELSARIRILKKLQFYASQENFLIFTESLKDARFGNWRFRIGEYRIIFDIEKDEIVILKVGRRKDIYK